MSRRGSIAALIASVALVAGAMVALVGGVAMGAWQPAGPARLAPNPTPGSGGIPGMVEYGQFLDDVRAGSVLEVFRDGDLLHVNTSDGGYSVQLPPGDPDVYDDMQAAADAGGVPTPGYSSSQGPDETPEPLSYPAFLEEVAAGRIYEVFQTDDRLDVNAVDGRKDVVVPAGADVLDDIEAAAEAGEIPPPVYTKQPGTPG